MRPPQTRSWLALVVSAALMPSIPATGADTPARPGASPKVWAVVVGVESYPGAKAGKAQGVARNELAVKNWLTNTRRGGWPEAQVLVLDDQDGAAADPSGLAKDKPQRLRATRRNLDWAFAEWLSSERVKPGDVVLVYLAGRFLVVGDDTGGRSIAGLLPADADATRLSRTVWRADEAVDLVASRGDCPVVVWIDGLNHTEAAAARPAAPAPADPVVDPSRQYAARFARWDRSTAWVSFNDEQPPAKADAGLTRALLSELSADGQPPTLQTCLAGLKAKALPHFTALGVLPTGLTLAARAMRVTRDDPPEVVLQRGHSLGVDAFAASADGSRLFSGSKDSTVRVWDVRERALLGVLEDHRLGVAALTLAAGGATLVTADGMGDLRFFDAASSAGPPLAVLRPNAGLLLTLAPLADGRHVVTLHENGPPALWDAAARPPVRSTVWGEAVAEALAVSASKTPDAPVLLAALGVDGAVILYGPDLKPARKLAPDAKDPSAQLRLSADGLRLAVSVGTKLRVFDALSGKALGEHVFPAGVSALEFEPGPDGALAVASGREVVTLGRDDPAGKAVTVCSAGFDVKELRFEGSYVMARGEDGAGVWDAKRVQATPRVSPAGVSISAAYFDANLFATGMTDGRVIVDSGGRLRNQGALPSPYRGQVVALSASSDGRWLFDLTRDGRALLLDFSDDGKLSEVKLLPGTWSHGAVTPDGGGLILAPSPDQPTDAGAVLEHYPLPLPNLKRRGLRYRPDFRYRLPTDAPGERFVRLAVSADGRRVVGHTATLPGRVVVWNAAPRRSEEEVGGGFADQNVPLRQVILGPSAGFAGPTGVACVDLSDDGKTLLVAADDLEGTVLLYKEGAGDSPARIAFKSPVVSARLGPGGKSVVVAGKGDGLTALYRNPSGGAWVATELGRLAEGVNATAFSADGKLVAAVGDDRRLHVWSLDAVPVALKLPERGRHTERVNALIPWRFAAGAIAGDPAKRATRAFMTGGDDTSVRLWDPDATGPTALLATFSAAVPADPLVWGEPENWALFTPDGQFDNTAAAGFLKLNVGGRVVESRQIGRDDAQAGRAVAAAVRSGRRPEAWGLAAPIELAIEGPTALPGQQGRAASLKISTGSVKRPGTVRLYHNGVPIFERKISPRGPKTVEAKVRLDAGVNRFYAMASVDGGDVYLESRSREVEIAWNAPPVSGRLHALALGVSGYRKRTLKFADADAREIAARLKNAGVLQNRETGEVRVLTNDEVTPAAVDEAFDAIEKATKGRPEDTIVVSLAGHADVLDGRFTLLLSSFPFPDAAVGNVALRDAGAKEGLALDPAPAPAGATLPFEQVAARLARLECTHRLVVIDACKAGTVDREAIGRLRSAVDRDGRKTQTAYILATRGEGPAAEAAPLKHGLLSYVVLRGLAAPGLAPADALKPGLRVRPDADADRDGVVTSDELFAYVEDVLPDVVDAFPEVASRGPDALPVKVDTGSPSGRVPSFPLVTLKPAASKPAAGGPKR